MKNTNEAMLIYTAIDFSDLCVIDGFTKVLEECVNTLNSRQYPFTDEEKDALGLLLFKEGTYV